MNLKWRASGPIRSTLFDDSLNLDIQQLSSEIENSLKGSSFSMSEDISELETNERAMDPNDMDLEKESEHVLKVSSTPIDIKAGVCLKLGSRDFPITLGEKET